VIEALLDFRVRTGGLDRYGRTLIGALQLFTDALRVVVLSPDSALGRLRLAPFTPWGRLGVGRAARRASVQLVHGLHLEIPSIDIPRVVTIHDLIPIRHRASMPSGWRRAAFERIVRSSLDRADKVIVPSEVTASDLERYGADMEKVVVVLNGIDTRWFRVPDDDERARARQRFAGGERYVVTIASSRSHKNFSVMTAVADRVLAQSGVRTICVGDASAVVSGGAMSSAGWLSGDDLVDFYGGADVFVLPSLLEGFGYPALEAAARGVPVVLGSEVGVRRYLADGALEVDVRDPAALSAAVSGLLAAPLERAEAGLAGAAAASALTAENMARGTLEVYRAALEAR
jgi:glycosyltransferase involved in cell wall biosynthesis